MSSSKQLAKKDIMILVLGATGAGKSFFINAILREERMKVGRDLTSCTTELDFGYLETIEGYPSLKDYRIVLIDTPGFNDCYTKDFQIMEKIATWLRQAYKDGSKLGGVLYLHDITTARFDSAARRNLQIFQSLCRGGALDNVILATTKWGFKIPNSEDRQTQLITDYWRPLIDKGARIRRFDTGHESAWGVIDAIFTAIEQGKLNQTVLQIQQGLLDPNATTNVGKFKKAFLPFIGLFRRNQANHL